jgi:hypothetical protein
MKEIKSFLLGMATVLLIIPVIDKLLELIFQWIEALKITPIKIVAKGNKDLVILKDFLKPTNVYDGYDDFDDEE